jgi:TRAP-type C4-dicarboxylate transport system permease small subunit
MKKSILHHINSLIFRVIKELLITIGLVLIVLVFVGVVLRYIFGLSIVWAYEVSILLARMVVMLGAVAGVRLNSHVNLDMFVNMFPASGRKWVLLLKDLIVLAFLAIGTVYGFKVLGRTMQQHMQTVNIPVGVIYMAIPVSFIPMILFFLEDVISRFGTVKPNLKGED